MRKGNVLSLRLSGEPVAVLTQSKSGETYLKYEDSWLGSDSSYAVSPTMPLSDKVYKSSVVSPFLSGLLPDNPAHKKMIASTFHVAYENDFSLLSEIGRDCAGAVSIVHEDDPVVLEKDLNEDYEAIVPSDLVSMLRNLPKHPLFMEHEDFRFSLAGVNDKAAVLVRDGRICIPKNGYPSSHILKTDIHGLTDSIKVECFALQLAGRMGLRVPKAKIYQMDDVHFMLISRYDRYLTEHEGRQKLRRIHQIDFCQAANVYPNMKYEDAGGPGWKKSFQILEENIGRERLDKTRLDLLKYAVYQFMIGNPDAHAKNYSMTCKRGEYDLAPLYDVNNSKAFHKNFKKVNPKMAMSIGGEFNPNMLASSHWVSFARSIGVSPGIVRTLIVDMASSIADEASSLESDLRQTSGWSDLLGMVVDDLGERSESVLEMFDAKSRLISMK